MRSWQKRLVGAIVLTLVLAGFPALGVSALAPHTSAFQRTWERTDQPVANQSAVRTWMWGPGGFSAAMWEPYDGAPNGRRLVQYYDKSRMEDNSYRAADAPWDVSNGLLVNELVSGQLQVGDNTFESLEPARVGIAGDPDDASGVTYWFMGLLRDTPAAAEGGVINRILTPGAANNLYMFSDTMAAYGVRDARFVPETQHTIAAPFWEFMNASGQVYENGTYSNAQLFQNPFYATGFPITDAYWSNVKLAGSQRDVLIQCFERRCLTYTPGNQPEWQVEMGNVGQHYYIWRHGATIPTEPPAIEIDTFDRLSPAPLVEWPFNLEGEALVILQNDSPYPLQVTFDGPTSHTFTIPPNPDGVVYPNPQAYPGCDVDGPTGEAFLPPGNYRVKLDFIGGNVDPGRGHWTLIPNAGYSSCHYVVDQDGPEPTVSTTGNVDVTHVLWDSPVPDEVSGEHVVLQNIENYAIQMQGWRIVDAQGNTYTFPGFVLQPGSTVTVHNCNGQNDASNLYSGACEATWNNGGDTATLFNANGDVIDSYSY